MLLQVVNDVAAGLAYMHPNVIHSDLKPQNILLDRDGRAKIADFGISRVKVGNDQAFGIKGMLFCNARSMNAGIFCHCKRMLSYDPHGECCFVYAGSSQDVFDCNSSRQAPPSFLANEQTSAGTITSC